MTDTIIALCSDTHCGSSLGLMKPDPFPLHDGAQYHPSPLQRTIWRVWEEGWTRIATERKKRRLIVVHNGDATEGLHHNTTQIVSNRIDEHEAIHIDCMDWALSKVKFAPEKGDALYYVAGTEEHSGNGSRSEEVVAADLGAVAKSEKRYTWDLIKKRVNGVVTNISHHGAAAGGTPLTDDSPIYNRIKYVYYDCLEHKQPIPRYWIRAHGHRFAHAIFEGTHGIIEGFMLPAFQFKTGYVYKRFNGRAMPSDIGMIWLYINSDGKTWFDKELIEIEQDEVGEW